VRVEGLLFFCLQEKRVSGETPIPLDPVHRNVPNLCPPVDEEFILRNIVIFKALSFNRLRQTVHKVQMNRVLNVIGLF
jgi:hypothetical protein